VEILETVVRKVGSKSIMTIIVAACIVAPFLIAEAAQAESNGMRSVVIQVSAQGNWSGFYVNQESRIEINGAGNTLIQLNRPSNATAWNIIVRIYETGPSNYTLIVRISTLSGQVLDEDYASTRGTSALATFTITPVFCLGYYYRCLSGN
jgi:hypothetical protein